MNVRKLKMHEQVKLYKYLEESKDRLTENPKTYQEIAKEAKSVTFLDVSPSTISSMCKDIGIPSRNGNSKIKRQEETDQRIALLEEQVIGLTIRVQNLENLIYPSDDND
jgi:hypothetical protein